MDDSNNITNTFELLLQKKRSKKPSIIYKNVENRSEQTYKPQDVIKTVYSQVKAIQRADCSSSGNRCVKISNEISKSHFLPVNKLPVYGSSMEETPKENPQKFETECVLDTQLINIIDGTDEVDANTGMMQEFDTTFTHIDYKDAENTNNKRENEIHPNIVNPDKPKKDNSSLDINSTKKSTQSEHVDESGKKEVTPVEDHNDIIHNSKMSDTATEKTLTFIQNITNIEEESENLETSISKFKDMNGDSNNSISHTDEDVNTLQFSQRSPSPVLNIKTLNRKHRKLKKPSPLIVSLEAFEKFENYAISLIEETDFGTAKHVINSQIIDKELYINDETEFLLGKDSPILDFKSDELQIKSEDILLSIKKVENLALLQNIQDLTEKRSDILKDEILFSSDEEDFSDENDKNDDEKDFFNEEGDFSYKGNDFAYHYEDFADNASNRHDVEDKTCEKFENLPLTQALETSRDESDILEENMFVSFQTASNKSIQVCRDSFNKARCILDVNINDDKAAEELSLTELVEKCEGIKSKPIKCPAKFESFSNSLEIKFDKNEQVTHMLSCDVSKKITYKIQVMCEDNDINKKNTTADTETCKHQPDKELDYVKDELIIDDKINDELLLQEFENIEMSLEENKEDKMKSIECKGFKTASNNCIEISKESITKTKNLFQDMDIEFDAEINNSDKKTDKEINSKMISTLAINKASTSNNTFVGFKTASNKEIKISEEALTKSKDVFKDLGKDKNRIQTIEDILSQPSTSKVFVGFKTANNKDIKLSKEALSKTKYIFKDVDKPGLERADKNRKSVLSKAEIVELKTAYHEEIRISDEGLSKTKDIDKVKTGLESSESAFVGFKTASNKAIKISNEALAKTKHVFKDINKQEYKSDIKVNANSSTRSVVISDSNKKSNNATSKSEEVYLDIDKELFLKCDFEETEPIFRGFESTIETDEILEKCKKLRSSLENYYDETVDNAASNKNNIGLENSEIQNHQKSVFAEALKKCNIFSNLEADSKDKPFTDLNKSPIPDFKGFQTASNKPVTISAEAIAKSKRIFQDIDETGSNIPEKSKKIIGYNKKPDEICKIALTPKQKQRSDMMDNQVRSTESVFIGFKTASNKNVKMSDEALAKCKKIFEDIEDIPISVKHVPKYETKDCAFKGFQTSNNAKVEVSKEALEKTKDIFSDIDNYSVDNPGNAFEGFKTASNKNVKISNEALAKCKKIFEDIEDVPMSVGHVPKYETKDKAFKGFHTANKKKVEISKEAIEKTKNIFSDMDNCIEKEPISAFVGFKTASNKNVNISNEALAKSKRIFDGIEDLPVAVEHDPEFAPQNNIFKGFQTANKKKVEISKESIEKVKDIFSDIDNFALDGTGKAFVGFKTASNNNVKVSAQSLVKSKQLFKDIDIESDMDVPTKDKFNKAFDNSSENTKIKGFLGFKTGTDKEIKLSQEALDRYRQLLADDITEKKYKLLEKKIEDPKQGEEDMNIEGILDSQVISNFDENLCTEDFRDTPKPTKRPGSPILVCPKAKKRRKFETPYKINSKISLNFQKGTEEKEAKITTLIFKDDYKKNKIYTLKDLDALEKNQSNKDIDPYILKFTLETLLDFEFDEQRNDLKEGKMTIDNIKQIFKEAADKKIIPEGWLDIHLKMILWKLISYEIRFPKSLGKVCTVRNVIDQLKYRYDKELYNAERSVLRKILEKDDVPTKTMVLCVAGIYQDGVSVVSATNLTNIELLLTDGWYFIKATIDNMLSKIVYDGKIVVGKKIITCGAELLNCEQGVAPWEDTSSIRLSISGNSTRPARWSEKLGLRPSSLLARLKHVRVGGGKVPRICVKVVRVYPNLYVEKFEDGSTVTRSERLEHQYQARYEAENEAAIEKIYEEVEKEMADQESQDSETQSMSGNKRKCYESGSQIAKMMKSSKDPMEFRAQLTSSQIHLLQEHMSRQRDKQVQCVQERVRDRVRARNVITRATGRVLQLERDGDIVTVTKGMLSIWKPNDEVLDIFKEGSWIEISNVVPTALRNSEIQLSAGRQSLFRPVKCKDEEIFKSYLTPLSRNCFKIDDLSQNPGMTTDYNEIDTVGIIFAIEPKTDEFESKNQFQNIYLADVDKNMICVNFWGGIKKFGFENILDTGQIIYCGNLLKRAGNSRKNIPQYRATEFSVFTKTPKNDKAKVIVEEINKKMFGLDRRKFCDDCVAIKQNYSVIKSFNDNETPYRFNTSDFNLTKNKMFIDTPVGVRKQNKMEDFNLTGLDFESTFRQQDTQELSPRTLQRKKKVNEKIARLKMYGEPPPLSTISIINKSKNATSTYKSPLLMNKSEATKNSVASEKNKSHSIATPKKLPDNRSNMQGDCVNSHCDNLSSPVLMNRTFVKRNVNPVKLNFSVNVDHFAEEFDGSPPLSLE